MRYWIVCINCWQEQDFIINIGCNRKNVLLFLSGGVDSTVAFALLNKALGQERVLGLHIDNGFMRKDESHIIGKRYRDFGFENFITEDASGSFLQAVYKETDPQKKRMAVGENFITVRNRNSVFTKYDLSFINNLYFVYLYDE